MGRPTGPKSSPRATAHGQEVRDMAHGDWQPGVWFAQYADADGVFVRYPVGPAVRLGQIVTVGSLAWEPQVGQAGLQAARAWRAALTFAPGPLACAGRLFRPVQEEDHLAARHVVLAGVIQARD